VSPAVLSQSGLGVALPAPAEEAEGRLRVVVSPSVEARRLSGVVEAAAYFIVATLPVMLAAGQRVVRVPTRLMADARRAGRDRGKSDPIDAEAVAWAALRHPDLPVASLDGASREVKLLSDFRRDLVRQRTSVQQDSLVPSRAGPVVAHPSRGLRRCLVDQIARELDRFELDRPSPRS